jgi:hypothetical protein
VAALVPLCVIGLDRAAHGSWAGAFIAAAAMGFAAVVVVGLGPERFKAAPRMLRYFCFYSYAFGGGWLVADFIHSGRPLAEIALWSLVWALLIGSGPVVSDLLNGRKVTHD